MTCNHIWTLLGDIRSKNTHTYDLLSVGLTPSPEAELDRLALKALPENGVRATNSKHCASQVFSAPREVFARAM